VTGSEARRIVALLAGGWPGRPLPESAEEVYALALGDLDYEAAKAAVMRLIQTSRFLPTVAEIREAAVRDRVSLPGPEEAWGIVRQAIGSSGGSYVVPAFDCLEIQLAVDDLGWREICLSEQGSTRARFCEAYRVRATRRLDAEARGLPAPGRRRALPSGEGAPRVVAIETGYPTAPAAAPAELEPGSAMVLALADHLTRRRDP
jgi:hypothetical protein